MTKKKFQIGDKVVFLKNQMYIPIGTTGKVIRLYNKRYPYRVELENGESFLCLEEELDFYVPFVPPANNQGVWS